MVPGIPGCANADVTILGEGAVAARWRLGAGGLLTLLVNLGPTDVDAPATAGGDAVFATREDLAERVRGGVLPSRSTLALLDAGGR